MAATIPAAIAGFLLNDLIETVFRDVGLVAFTLVVGAVILWLADRWGGRTKGVDDVTFPVAIAIGAAQALALVPGISRSGISISAGRFAGLDREAAARFSFLMATPITAGAAIFEIRKLAGGETGVDVSAGPLDRRDARRVRGRDARDRVPAALPADALADDLRRLPARAGGGRRRRVAQVARGRTGERWKS